MNLKPELESPMANKLRSAFCEYWRDGKLDEWSKRGAFDLIVSRFIKADWEDWNGTRYSNVWNAFNCAFDAPLLPLGHVIIVDESLNEAGMVNVYCMPEAQFGERAESGGWKKIALNGKYVGIVRLEEKDVAISGWFLGHMHEDMRLIPRVSCPLTWKRNRRSV